MRTETQPDVVNPTELTALVERLHRGSGPEGTTTADVAASLGMDEAQVREALARVREEARTKPERDRQRQTMRLAVGSAMVGVVLGGFVAFGPLARQSVAVPPLEVESIELTGPSLAEEVGNAPANVAPSSGPASLEDLGRLLPRGLNMSIAGRKVAGANTSGVFAQAEVMRIVLALEPSLGTPASVHGTDVSRERFRQELNLKNPTAIHGLGLLSVTIYTSREAFGIYIPRGPTGWTNIDGRYDDLARVRKRRLAELEARLADLARRVEGS